MERSTTTELQNTSSTAMSVMSGLAGVVTFAGVFAATFYFGFQVILPLITGGAVGLVAGVVAAGVAKKHGSPRLAKASIIICLVCGAVGGLILAAPLAAVMIGISLLTRNR